MRYQSTRGTAPELGFSDVMLTGLARDGGLYAPKEWPALAPREIAALAGRPYHEVAAAVVGPFTGGEIAPDALLRMAEAAYARFGHPAVTPLIQIAPGRFVLELFHGPTLAFKDLAMQLLARLMDHVLAARGERATIVGATSGDTGGAAIEAFRGSERVDVVILYPDGRVSGVQRRMMTTPEEENVHAVAVAGTFDDCQALLKAMFNDHAFRDEVRLSAVNSINWARIVAQAAYYFAAATALGGPGRRVSFAVPTGNFGDVLAGSVARRMGLAIERLLVASNENDILPRAFESGVYEMRKVQETSSPSMDIQISSNFERSLYEASGHDAALVCGQMASLAQSGRFEITPQLPALRQEFAAASASEQEVGEAIRATLAGAGYLADPHTACAIVAADKRPSSPHTPEVILATAHPAKFPDAMAAHALTRPELPARLAGLLTTPERITRIGNDIREAKALVRARARAVGGRGR
jgi:threonine synthase